MFKPWLHIPAQWAHQISPLVLPILGYLREEEIPQWKSFTWRNIYFPNRLGLAGGVDKNGDLISTWWSLGAGFLEIGTVTPQPQLPHPGVTIARDIPTQTLWNKMGFPSLGSDAVYDRIENALIAPLKQSPILLNIGKNRNTSNEEASLDYLFLIEKFEDLVDGFVINISSPNTLGLRALQSIEYLPKLLTPLRQKTKRPLFVKLSPDLSTEDLVESTRACLRCSIDGFVLTNTTTQRSAQLPYPPEGGVSGLALAESSKRALRTVVSALGGERKNKLIISVGGVLSPEDVNERLKMGADLVEIYSALIFSGPQFFSETARFFNHSDTKGNDRNES